MKHFIMIILLALSCSWANGATSSNTVNTKAQTLAIARQEVETRDGWTSNVQYSATLSGKLWHITAAPIDPVTKQPSLIMDHVRTLMITDQGELVGYDGGGKVSQEELTRFERRLHDVEQRWREEQDAKYGAP